MAWESKTLKDAMPDAFDAAERVRDKAQAAIDKLNDALSDVNEALNDAETALNLTEQDIEKLRASGFAVIYLSPKKGSWLTRLVNAPDAPSTSAGYSCGYFNLATAPTEAQAMTAFNSMKAALTEKMKIADYLPEFPEPVEQMPDTDIDFRLDKWIGKTLGQLMPGVFNSLKAVWNAQKIILERIKKAKRDLEGKKALIEASWNAAISMIAGLSNTGLYQYRMAPATGSWADRAASETGAPPTTGDQYCFGFAAVAVAADMAGCQALYQKLQNVM